MHTDDEIRAFLDRVAQLGDRGSADAYLDQFRSDAVTTMAANERRGTAGSTNRGHDVMRKALAEARAAGIVGPDSDAYHVVSITAITISDADHATAESEFQFFTNASTSPTLASAGTYHDVVVRDTDGWKLARRTITLA